MESPAAVPGAVPLNLNVNGKEYRVNIESRVTLLDALRDRLQLFGTKKGCDHGQCGACTVHVNGRRVNSCLSFAIMHQGDKIVTIEGLAQNGHLHPVQKAFLEHDGFQCGYCTPGQIMSASALLQEPIGPDDNAVRAAMSGNICRCGAYNNIVAAVQQARSATSR
jgi:xanthine dehydrogenase YagT iron-sulfur-binding subunit